MRKILTLLVLSASLLATPSLAEEKPAAKAEPMIQLAPVALPITQDGRIVNYVFLSIKVMLSPKADMFKLVNQEPYYRDALVRAAHRQNMGKPGDPNRVDEAVVKATLKREAASFMDARLITGIQVVRQDPKKYLPKPTAPVKP